MKTIALIVLSILVLLTACNTSTEKALLTSEERQLNVESFEYAWHKINDEYWDQDFGGVNWQAVYDELRPEIEQANTMDEARDILNDMVSRLGVSHFAFFPAADSSEMAHTDPLVVLDGVTGIDLRVLDGQAIITSVIDGSPAAVLGVQPGWEIVRISNTSIRAFLHKRSREQDDMLRKPFILTYSVVSQLTGQIGDTLTVAFRDEDDQWPERRIPLAKPEGKNVRFGYIPTFDVRIQVDTLEHNIGYISWNSFFDPASTMKVYNDAMRRFMNADGLILDLRGNPGGIGEMALGMMGWLIPEKNRHIGTMHTRNNVLKMIVNPRPETYDGPVAVLVDGVSGSASEFFAGGLQELRRACIVGTRTCGAALPGQIYKLPNGMVFLYATANFLSASGKPLEGVGIIPDIEAQPTREALLEGRDLVREAAIDWILSQSS